MDIAFFVTFISILCDRGLLKPPELLYSIGEGSGSLISINREQDGS
jgi:hypothetical protein